MGRELERAAHGRRPGTAPAGALDPVDRRPGSLVPRAPGPHPARPQRRARIPRPHRRRARREPAAARRVRGGHGLRHRRVPRARARRARRARVDRDERQRGPERRRARRAADDAADTGRDRAGQAARRMGHRHGPARGRPARARLGLRRRRYPGHPAAHHPGRAGSLAARRVRGRPRLVGGGGADSSSSTVLTYLTVLFLGLGLPILFARDRAAGAGDEDGPGPPRRSAPAGRER